jgi:hypothetical protein
MLLLGAGRPFSEALAPLSRIRLAFLLAFERGRSRSALGSGRLFSNRNNNATRCSPS